SASLEEILAFGSRMRPDRILVGDLRGSEALALVDLATAGFAGCISTIQAPSASAALRRLEFFASKAAGEVPVSLLRSHIASGLDLIVLVDRSPDGEPRIAEVVRLDEAEEHDVYRLQTQSGERREPNGKEAE
ncbi:MAG: ATPase, T2SS/T4P/T4SS family, partial [Myxococcota bacterium]